MRQPIRIVAFVGTGTAGDYKKAKYRLGGVTSDSVRLMAAALCSIAHKQGGRVQGVELLVTTDALAYYESGLVPAKETIRAVTGHDPRTTIIDPGGSDDELRQLFMTVHAALTPEARPELGETEAPAAIWLDTTHGYRAQSFLGAAALSYTLSDWSRRRLDATPEVRVFYAFYDDTQPDAPQRIWDLTEFVAATRWNAALDALVRFGRADDVLALAKLEEHTEPTFPSRLGEAVQRFADDLTLIRLRDLLTRSSPALTRILDPKDASYMGFIAQRPYLEKSFSALHTMAQSFSARDVLGKAGLAATARLAHAYGKLQQFAAQMVAVREAVVTAYAITEGLRAVDPGPGCRAPRKQAEKAWQDAVLAERNGRAPSRPSTAHVTAFSAKVQQPRNDVEHAGVTETPDEAPNLRTKAQALADELMAIVATIGS